MREESKHRKERRQEQVRKKGRQTAKNRGEHTGLNYQQPQSLLVLLVSTERQRGRDEEMIVCISDVLQHFQSMRGSGLRPEL